MKRIIIILLFCVLGQLSMATEKVKLTEEPWRAIVFMEKYRPGIGWEDNISIKLFGSYTQTDSLMIENSIRILNELCETVKLSITTHDLGNLEIFFLDSTNEKTYESRIVQGKDVNSKSSIDYNYHKTNGVWMTKSIRHYDQSFRLAMIPENSRQNFITNTLAFALFPKKLSIQYLYKNGREVFTYPNSIFCPETSKKDSNPFYSELRPFDRQLIKTVYASNFAVLLPIAKKQFDESEYPEWVRNHSYEILVFPFVLVVFLLVGLFILLYRKLFSHIHDKWAQFNAILALALPLLGVLIATYFMTALSLKYPFAPNDNQSNLLAGIVITCMLGLPALNLIRLIEVAINRRTKHKYIKTLLLFLSTSLIPSGTLLAIAYFITNKNIQSQEFRAILVGFLVFTIIGIIRALISFFVLKEKEIKIENEVKMANLRELKTKAELNALHSKINPHFLYNSLNSIAGLAKTNAEKAEHMALSLSKLFRYSINKEQSDWSTLIEELEMVKVYLDIEKVRFDDRLDYYIDLPKELEMVQIPQFLIQPLAENAIKHGISKLVDNGIVKISVRKIDTWLEINVADNGPDFPNELNPGFGLQSIYDKLEILFPDKFEMHFLNSPNKHIQIKLALK